MENEDPVVQPFDLYMAGNPVHELKNHLSQITDQIAQRFSGHLSGLLSADVQVVAENLVNKTVLKSETDSGYFRSWVYFNNDLRCFGTIEIHRSMMTRMIDLMCGGTGAELGKEMRSDGPQKAEKIMVVKAIRMFFESFETVYSNIRPVTVHMTSKAQDALFEAEKKIRDQEFVVSSVFKVTVGDVTGDFKINAPSYVMGTINSGQSVEDAKKSSERLETLIQGVLLPVSATLGRRTVSLRKVFSLKPGDIIPLSEPLNAEVYVTDKHLLTAKVIADNHRLALQVVQGKTAKSSL